jgi:general secretion pathway protein M
VNLGKVFERFDARERRLLRFLSGFMMVAFFVLVIVGSKAVLASSKEQDEALRNAISEITSSQASLAKAEQRRQTIAQRYARAAPPLAAFLDGLAKESGVEIPESQDRPVVPHGKRYEERAIRLQLRRVALGNLARFLEKIEQAGHPIVLSKLNIRKRLTEPDSYDVELIVSAYDRKELPKSEGSTDTGKGDADGASGADKAAGESSKELP